MASDHFEFVGIKIFRMLEGVKVVYRRYDMRILLVVGDLSRVLYKGTQRVNESN